MDLYRSLLQRAQNVSNTPYQAYTGELTAPMNAQQNAGIAGINAAANYADPYIKEAAGMARSASSPLTSDQIQQYMSPYTQQVVDATQNQFNTQNQQQQTQLSGNAIAQGGLGGNRVGVAQGTLAGQQQMAQAPVMAGLRNTGYQTGLNTALAEQQAQMAGAYAIGSFGTAGQNAALQGAGAQFGAGTAQQNTQQQSDTAKYQQFQQQQAYPFQTAQWLAGLGTGVGSQMGGTSSGTTTGPSPNSTGQWLGAGLSLAGMFLNKGGRVPGFDSGGTVGGTPFGGSSGWVPSIGITGGHGAPSGGGAGQVSNPNSNASNPAALAKQAAGLGKSLMGGFGQGDTGWGTGTVNEGGAGMSGYGLTGGDIAGMPLDWGLGLARGGRIPGFDDGGGVAGDIPLDFNPGIAGFSPNGGFDMRYAAIDPSINAVSKSYEPYKSAGFGEQAPANGPSFNDRFNGEPPAEKPPADLNVGAPISIPQSPGFPGQQAPATGKQAIPSAMAENQATPTQGYVHNIGQYGHAIGSIESGGNYNKEGPATKTGDHAYGRYQVMGANIPQWTKDTLGQSLTPTQFLHSPEAQDAVFNAKFGQYVNKYGPEGASRAWFAGEGGMNNPNARDSLGTSVSSYSNKFMAALNGKAPQTQVAGVGDEGADNAQLPPNSEPAQGKTQEQQQGPLGKLLSGLGVNPNFSPETKAALMSAGFGMMASKSPFLGVGVGEGAQQGMQTYYGMKNKAQEQAIAGRKVDLETQKLSQAADMAQKNLALKTKESEGGTWYQRQEAAKPVLIRKDVDAMGRTHEVYAQRMPDGGYADPMTGKRIDPSAPNGDQQSEQSNAPVPTGEDFLTGVDPTTHQPYVDPKMRNMVRQVAGGDIDISKATGMKDKFAVSNLAAQYDPSYNTFTAPARQQMVKEFTSGGLNSPAAQITAGTTGVIHAARMLDYIQQMKQLEGGLPGMQSVANAGVPYLSKWAAAARNSSLEGTGTPAAQAYGQAMALRELFTDEIKRFYSGSQAGEYEKKRALDNINMAKSLPELEAVVRAEGSAMADKVGQLQSRFEVGMGPMRWGRALASDVPAGDVDGKKVEFPILRKAASDALDHIMSTDPARRAAMPAQSNANAGTAQPKVGEERQFKQGVGVWNGTAWVPKAQ